jgi:hypothetical protein
MIGFMFFVMTILVIGLGILGVAAGLRRINPPESPPEISPTRLDRIESALGSMEARLDDLQDQQRFLERLLAERPETPSLGAGGGTGEEENTASERSILFDTEPEEER